MSADIEKYIVDIIAPYHRLTVDGKEIIHPSQALKKKIKNSEWHKLTSDDKKILKAFKEKIKKAIEVTKSYKKMVYIVYPPSKDDKNNQIISLFEHLQIKGEFKIIEFASEKYSLKSMKKIERIEYMKNSYKGWTINNSIRCIPESEKPFFIFIDDIVTTGTTSKYVIKAISERYKLKEKPLYRSIYLMGTKSSKEFREDKIFELPYIW